MIGKILHVAMMLTPALIILGSLAANSSHGPAATRIDPADVRAGIQLLKEEGAPRPGDACYDNILRNGIDAKGCDDVFGKFGASPPAP